MAPHAPPPPSSTPRVVLITGGSSGIGAAAAERFVAMGDTVVLCSRPEGRGADVADALRRRGQGEVHFIPADLSTLAGMRRLAGVFKDGWDRLDAALLNAGVIAATRQLTEDGIETTWATNHLGVFVPALLLLGPLRAAAAPQVVVTSSAVAQYSRMRWDDLERARGYTGWRAYGQSKLANQLFVLGLAARSQGLAARSQGAGLGVHAFHPGVVGSDFGQGLTGTAGRVWRWLQDRQGRTAEQGADTAVWLVDEPPGQDMNGRYWVDRQPRPMANGALAPGAADRLWGLSMQQARFTETELEEIDRHLGADAEADGEQ